MDWKRDLNEQQLDAVFHGEGPQLVLAGAGSGKTRVITYRIAWLIQDQGVDPGGIVAVTFTNKAAAEMAHRVESALGEGAGPPFVGTFHRFGVRLLRRYGDQVGLQRGFTIFDSTEQEALVKRALELEQLDVRAFAPRAILARISEAKNRLLDPTAYEKHADGFFETRLAQAYRRYQGLLRQSAAVDFDDLIGLTVKLLRAEEEIGERVRGSLRHLLVDEFQDTNHAQFELVRTLVGAAGNLTAVGDEDQGIYRWRGADLNNILGFEKAFPGARIRKLERNYRSTQNILDASGALVANNESRRAKRLWTENGTGELIRLYRANDETDEARWVVEELRQLRSEFRYSEMAVLVRTNAQTRALEDALLRHQVPYSLVAGVRFYERSEIKDLLAYLKVLRHPLDALSLARIINQPPRGIGRTTQELLRQEAEQLGLSVWDVVRLDQLGRLPARGARALRQFRQLMLGLAEEMREINLADFLERLVEKTGYGELYRQDDPEGAARLENIREFFSAARDFVETQGGGALTPIEQLTTFLDHAALMSDVDGWVEDRGVALMTLHSAKGLEFPVVAVTGLEDGLLPHFNSQASQEELEEERRLLYVGMTRAQRRLYLTTCRRRRVAGRYQDQSDSCFLSEIPRELVDTTVSPYMEPRPERRPWSPARGSSPRDASPTPDGALRKGTHVRHATLGQGVVLDQEGEGENAKLTVYFERVGKRKLVAKYAGLTVVSG